VPAGLFIARVRDDEALELELDYAIPGYRDFKIGRHLYSRGALHACGYRTITAEASGDRAADYLAKMGFTRARTDGSWNLVLR
jgi:hypothetical protein